MKTMIHKVTYMLWVYNSDVNYTELKMIQHDTD